MAKYLLLKHYRGAPEAVNSVPIDQWTPQEIDDHVQYMNDFAARLESSAVAAIAALHADAPRADGDRLGADRRRYDELLLPGAHPSLSPASAVALTLRAIGGLTTRQIARAYLVPEATMAQRISRAKRTVVTCGSTSRATWRPYDGCSKLVRSGPNLAERHHLTRQAARLQQTAKR